MNTKIKENKLDLIFGGKAVITFESNTTGKWYTYKIVKSKKANIYFVSVLRGTDNTSSYTYLGTIFNKTFFSLTNGSTFKNDSPAVVAFRWCFNKLIQKPDVFEKNITMYHSGHCCRCGRLLTTPQSVSSGFGPECINLINKNKDKTLKIFNDETI